MEDGLSRTQRSAQLPGARLQEKQDKQHRTHHIHFRFYHVDSMVLTPVNSWKLSSQASAPPTLCLPLPPLH